jgi:hypothetical protein
VAEKLGGRKTTPGFEYQCVGRYNYNKAELTVRHKRRQESLTI